MRPVMSFGRGLSASRFAGTAVVLLGASVGGLFGAFLGACVEQDDDKPTEEDMKTVRQNLLSAAPAPKYVVNADLDGKIVYLGLDTEPATVEPGKELRLTHYWKVVSAPSDGWAGWKVFTHIEGPNHASFVNSDHGPVGGKYPVTQWKVGDIIRDQHTITVPAGWTHDTLMIYVGLWRGATRLPIKSGPSDGAGRVLAASVPVQKPAKPVALRKRYAVRKTDKPLKIDGKLDEAAWKEVPSTGAFVNTMNGAPSELGTEAKLLWDDKYLYVAFENADTDVWSSLTKRDDKLWTQETVELMIDADGNGKGYVELQVAPNGNVFDTYLPQYRKYEDSIDPKRKPYSWNSRVNAKVVVDGTLNKHEDKDRSWTVELALPLEDVKGMDTEAPLPKLPPAVGDVWRANMFRMDVPLGKSQQAVAWSPPLVGDFHALDKFGELVFADDKGSIAPPPPPAPAPAAAAEASDEEKGKKGKGKGKGKGKRGKKSKEKAEPGADKAAGKTGDKPPGDKPD
jgi:hypothetical protein